MAAVAALADFTSGLGCAKKYAGSTITRNSCSNDWYYDLDLRLSQQIPGPGRLLGSPYGVRDKLTVYAMFDNFLNFLDDSENIQRRRNFAGLQEVAEISGVDSEGRYVISEFLGERAFQEDNFINSSSSLWRLKLGISYDF
jgi:hypothetical protein